MEFLLPCLAGALLCNAIPHTVSGLRGERFPTPFAHPPGRGLSSPAMNVTWASLNLAGGFACLARHPVMLAFNGDCLAFGIGAFVSGLALAIHFGKVRAENFR